ncbi:MAG: hypothetical protein RL065_1629, partial [Bacteroidota bacterium]
NAIKQNSTVISIYPNPTKDGKLFIQSDALINELTTIKLYNLTGSLIFEQSLNSAKSRIEINLSSANLSKGLYLINIQNNKSFITKKILFE